MVTQLIGNQINYLLIWKLLCPPLRILAQLIAIDKSPVMCCTVQGFHNRFPQKGNCFSQAGKTVTTELLNTVRKTFYYMVKPARQNNALTADQFAQWLGLNETPVYWHSCDRPAVIS